MQMLALQELEAESQQDAPVNLIVLQDTKKVGHIDFSLPESVVIQTSGKRVGKG
jgi:hypothetical protein